jgi:Protein of unknown function (DUF4065)
MTGRAAPRPDVAGRNAHRTQWLVGLLGRLASVWRSPQLIATVVAPRSGGLQVPELDRQRLEALVLWIAAETKDVKSFGRTKLAKVLFYSDMGAYRHASTPLTGATYGRWPFGPFPQELEAVEQDLAAAGKVILDYEVPEGEAKKIVPLVDPPDVSKLFEPWQLALVRIYIQQFSEQSSQQVSEESHLLPGWRMAGEYQPIPYETAFLPDGPPRPDQIERAKELARERGTLTDDGWIWER